MTDEDNAIRVVVDTIWDTYDTDNSGSLDKEETKKFVIASMAEVGDDSAEFTEDRFAEVYAQFD